MVQTTQRIIVNGSLLRQLRVEHKMSLEEVGSRVGVSKKAICFIELGYRNGSLSLIYRIAKLYGVTIDELLI